MSSRYTRPQTNEEKEQLMATRKSKVSETKERASVSRERRLALALRALLDAVADGEGQGSAESTEAVLTELGYGQLEGIPKQLARLTAELDAAVGAGNYGRVAELGQQLERVRAGKVSRAVEVASE